MRRSIAFTLRGFLKAFKTHGLSYTPVKAKTKTVKKAYLIMFDNADKQLASQRESIFEYTMLVLVAKLCKQKARKSKNWLLYYYTLTDKINVLLGYLAGDVKPRDIFKRAAIIVDDIAEHTVEEDMQIPDIDDALKMLLLLGIGVFTEHNSPRYLEIMKRLADEQKLFMVIASGHYVYGTNYQFCHRFLGKDMADMSQEKCIQAMARIGRGKQNHSYSIRFRSKELLSKLFHQSSAKPKADNMQRLFNACREKVSKYHLMTRNASA